MRESDTVPRVDELGRSLVRISVVLFVAMALVSAALSFAGAGRLIDALEAGHANKAVLAVLTVLALAPLHLNLLSPLIATRLMGARVRRLLPAESILIVRDDRETWRLFAHATVVTLAACAVHLAWSKGALGYSFGSVLLAVLLSALGFYRVVVITVLWFRHARSLEDAIGVLSRVEAAYRRPEQFFIDAVEGRREVTLERLGEVRVHVKYVEVARLAAASERPFAVEGAREVWRAAEPAGAEVLAGWMCPVS